MEIYLQAHSEIRSRESFPAFKNQYKKLVAGNEQSILQPYTNRFLFRTTNQQTEETLKTNYPADPPYLSSSNGLLSSLFYLKHRIHDYIDYKFKPDSFTLKKFMPIFYIIDRQSVKKDRSIKLRQGLEEEHEIEIKGDQDLRDNITMSLLYSFNS
jgi:hypothetical protein